MQDTATGQSYEPTAPAISLGDLSVGSAEQTGDAAKAAAAEAMQAATQRAVEIPVASTPSTVDVTAAGLVTAANQAARVPNMGEVATDSLPTPPATDTSLRSQVASFGAARTEAPTPPSAPVEAQPTVAPNPYTAEPSGADREVVEPSAAEQVAEYRRNAAEGIKKLLDLKMGGKPLDADQERMYKIFMATLADWN